MLRKGPACRYRLRPRRSLAGDPVDRDSSRPGGLPGKYRCRRREHPWVGCWRPGSRQQPGGGSESNGTRRGPHPHSQADVRRATEFSRRPSQRPAATVAGLDADIPGPSGFSNDGSALSNRLDPNEPNHGVNRRRVDERLRGPRIAVLEVPGRSRFHLRAHTARDVRCTSLSPSVAADRSERLRRSMSRTRDAGFQTALTWR